MSFYLLLPLVASIALPATAAVVYGRQLGDLASRYASLLLLGGGFWAACEVLWNTRTDPDEVMWLIKASTLGWVWAGPLALGLFVEITALGSDGLKRAMSVIRYLPVPAILIDWFTPWVHTKVMPTSWGWAYEVGPTFAVYHAFEIVCVLIAIRLGVRAYRTSVSPAEGRQAWLAAVGIMFPLVVASVTDGLLPMLGYQVPRLGTLSFAVMGGTIAWSFHRFGYSLLAPGAFARQILETLPDGVAMLRLDGRLRSANGAFAKLCGCEPEALVDVDASTIIRGLDGDLQEELVDVECELSAAHAWTPVAVTSTLVRDRQRSPLGIVLVVRDMREVESLRGRLVLSGRLASVGELAAGIAHEMNNPLAYVRANLSLLRGHWETLTSELLKQHATLDTEGLLAEGEEVIDESIEGVDRASSIVRDVKGLAHSGRGQHEHADVNALLDGVLRMAAPQLRGTAEVEKRYTTVLPLLDCAPQELQQVFLNLVINAGQAIEDRGTIVVETRVEQGAVVVSICDDGCGIAPELTDRIFDPFFTTKPMGEGTGLGLGIAYEIVRKHGGEIEVVSTLGEGTAFHVRLPLAVDTLGVAGGSEPG